MNLRMSLNAVAVLAMAGVLMLAPSSQGAEPTAVDEIAILRDVIKTDRTVLVAEAMQLSEEEGKAFWPLYREYREARDKINDGLVKLVLEYADVYPNVPEDRAAKMLKEYTVLELKLADNRVDYFKKFAKALSPTKALRLAQVENRLDLVVRLQMAGAIPLVPGKAK